MSDFRSQEAGSTNTRAFTVVAKASGSPITTGTVNWYLKNISGANAGKWWRDSDQTWQVTETANAMTHQADGHWTRTLAASPWTDGDVSLEYAKESGDLHIPISRMLKVEYTPTADSSRRVTVGAMAADVITASAIATDAIGSAELAASAVTEIQAGLSTLDAAGVRTAIGLASPNLDAQLTAIDDYIDTEVAAIKAKTDNLPSDPADASDIAASFTTVNTTLATISGYLDTEIATLIDAAARMLGLQGKHVRLESPTFDADDNILTYTLKVYDTGAHATAGGATGLLYQYGVTNTYSAGNLATSVTTQVS